MACAKDSSLDLGSVIGLAVVVLFRDHHGDGLDLFVGREPSAAGIADPSSADGVIILNRS
jgi:hypothetical protein